MIKVSLISGSQIVLNSDLIEFLEATPDTVVSLSNGKKFMVKESVTEVVEKVMEYKGRMARWAHSCGDAKADGDAAKQKESFV